MVYFVTGLQTTEKDVAERKHKSFLMEIFVGAATLSCIAANIKKQRMAHDEVEERS